ncbi:MAG: histidine kinase [Edaphobacter sp.]|uniref:sensor histidine kinase n=1 Tax=Edaphobacter sp. TaxID=1934404 RepID=UPI00239CA5EE|nr:ATP-binding protein [Edaphobacter sp.]MDE1178199.1 histidine kinase [Edaphobacter sp.]
MGKLEVASTGPGSASSTYLVRSVYGGFAAIVLLICMTAGLVFEGTEHIHAEAAHSLFSLSAGSLTHSNVDQLIAAQSRRLLGRVELILFLCGVSVIACGLVTVWTVSSNLRRIQAQSNELNLLSWRMSQEHEVVARRFSHEIHDEFGQMLTSMRMMLQQTTPEQFAARRQECLELIDEAIGNVRELSQLLRPVVLDDFGLIEALQGMTRRLEMQTGIRITYTSHFQGRLPEEIETQLFRIAQESLANMVRHSKATEAEVHISSINQWVTLTIVDNGVGFPPLGQATSARKGMGLVGMKARIRHMGGIMKAENHQGGGAQLFFSVPIRLAADAPQLEAIDA